jgi:hypothetical protein
MKCVLAVIASLLAAPVMAGDHPWSVFFEGAEADVRTGPDLSGKSTERVTLPGDVQLMRYLENDDWVYIGIDQSDAGAVGCMAGIYGELQRLQTHCPESFTPEQSETLTEVLGRIADFYVANAVPQTTREEMLAELPKDPLVCSEVTDDFIQFRDQMLSPDMTPIIDELLAEPRLPVTNPCL